MMKYIFNPPILVGLASWLYWYIMAPSWIFWPIIVVVFIAAYLSYSGQKETNEESRKIYAARRAANGENINNKECDSSQ